MSRSARSSPVSSAKKAPRDEAEIRSIALATEAAFERVRTARERLETSRRAKSMPNTPVMSEFRRLGDVWEDRAMQETLRGDAGATRLNFSDIAEDKDEAQPSTSEYRRQEGIEKSTKERAWTRDGEAEGCRDEDEKSVQVERGKLARETQRVSMTLPMRDEKVSALLIQAAHSCRKLEVVEADEEDEVGEEIGEVSTQNVDVSSQQAAQREKEKRVSERIALKNADLLKPPDFYRNSAHSSAVSLDASAKDRSVDTSTTDDSCSLM